MGREHVGHDDIARFAQEKVNLPKDKADEYRAQARRLREEMGMQRMDTVKRLLRRARAGSAEVLAPAWRSSRRGAARYGRRGL